jgi:hypothetical protein
MLRRISWLWTQTAHGGGWLLGQSVCCWWPADWCRMQHWPYWWLLSRMHSPPVHGKQQHAQLMHSAISSVMPRACQHVIQRCQALLRTTVRSATALSQIALHRYGMATAGMLYINLTNVLKAWRTFRRTLPGQTIATPEAIRLKYE